MFTKFCRSHFTKCFSTLFIVLILQQMRLPNCQIVTFVNSIKQQPISQLKSIVRSISLPNMDCDGAACLCCTICFTLKSNWEDHYSSLYRLYPLYCKRGVRHIMLQLPDTPAVSIWFRFSQSLSLRFIFILSRQNNIYGQIYDTLIAICHQYYHGILCAIVWLLR
jgi:hypothetical protein